MKTLQQVKRENPLSTVMTTQEFCQEVLTRHIIPFDGFGYYHDGEKETNTKVDFIPGIIWRYKDKYPYVCWYNN